MSERQLPWRAKEIRGEWCVVDDPGRLVAVCHDDGDGEGGRPEAVAICEAVNRAGEPICAHCGEAATCFGSYESELTPAFACNTCCAHGNEDGHCEQITEADE